ncbi:MAG: uracil-DNA glycosylase family protein [Alphaproteobacteria bacterium]
MGSRPAGHALLAWYLEMGVDEAIEETPVDRFASGNPDRPDRRVPPARRPVPSSREGAEKASAGPGPETAASFNLTVPEEAVHSARAVAAACTTIDALVEAIRGFERCALKQTATNTVIYDGNPDARLMLIGEAPGAEEDRQGLPFVGPAGRLLDRMLAAIELDRRSAYITNVLYWRPPGNRVPTAEEIGTCLPFAERQIELIAPRVVVFVGGIAAKAMLGRSEGITKFRGRWFRYQTPRMSAPVQATATYHSAFLLRQPGRKREAWRDLLAIKAKLALPD